MPSPSFTDIIRAYLEAQFGGDIPPIPVITVDDELSATSTNPVQNRIITAALALKAAIADIPKMATQANMSDWTSGKTVDAAVLKADFTNAMQALTRLADTVEDLQTAVSQKADSADIPTKTSDLTNDSGFQTASQVQTAIDNSLAQIPYAESEVF